MSWFNRNWDGCHRQGCKLYSEDGDDTASTAECSCADILVEQQIEAAEHYRDQMKEKS